MANGNKPEKKIVAGAICASIWKNNAKDKKGKTIEFHKVTLERRYKDGEEWKSTNSYSVNDIPKAVVAMQKAYEYLVLKNTEGNGDSEENAEEEEVY